MSLRLLTLSSATLLMAACATTTEAPPIANGCDAQAVQTYLGQSATPATIETARKAAGAEIVRTLKPGQVVTMEYRDGRLNVHVDASNTIVRATCG